MSYCGACGSFYSPVCPHREGGGCIPAVNPYEKQLIDAAARLTAIQISAKAVELDAAGDSEGASALLEMLHKLPHIHD